MFGMYPIVEAEPFYSFPYQDYHTSKHTPFKKHTPVNDLLFEMFEDDIFNSIFEIEPRLQTPKNKKNQENRGLYCNPYSPQNKSNAKDSFSQSVNSQQQQKTQSQQSLPSFSLSSCSSSEDNQHTKNANKSKNNLDSNQQLKDKGINQEYEILLHKLDKERKQRKKFLKKQQQNIQKKQRETSLIDICYPLLEVSESLEEVSDKDLKQDQERRSRKSSRQIDESLNSLSSIKDSDLKINMNRSHQESENEEKLNEKFYIQTQSIRSYENTKGEKTVIQRVEQNRNGDMSAIVSKKIYDKNHNVVYKKKWREDPQDTKDNQQEKDNINLNEIELNKKSSINIENDVDNTKNQDFNNNSDKITPKSTSSFDPRIVKESSSEKQYYGDNVVILQNLSNPKIELDDSDKKNSENKLNLISESETTLDYQH